MHKKWIDILKGIGIISVVAGHTFYGPLNNIIFLFHMPLFFFIGGYLFKLRNSNLKYFIDKSIHLLVPYFTFLLIFYLPFYMPSSLNSTYIDWLKYIFTPFVGGRLLSNNLGVFWFVTCFFITQQIFNLLINRFSKRKIVFIISIFFIISFFNSNLYSNFWLPWNVNVVFASLPFFYIGFILKKNNLKISPWIIFPTSTLIIILTLIIPSNTYDMKYSEYGIPFLTFISSIIIIISLKLISQKLEQYKYVSLLFELLGKSSMTIMYLHLPIISLLKKYIQINNFTYFILSIIMSLIIHRLILKFRLSRALLLGSKNDLLYYFNTK